MQPRRRPTQSSLRCATLPLALALSLPLVAAATEPFETRLGERRLEQHTPAGVVPAGPSASGALANGGDEQSYIAEAVGLPADQVAAIVETFGLAYRAAGAPRLAVYFNRELSEEVREWIPGTQHQIDSHASASYQGYATHTGAAGMQASTDVQMVQNSRHYIAPTGRRNDPAEVWMWQFEDGVTAQLLESGANLVDRALMFRKMAKLAPQTAGLDGAVSTTVNEIGALEEFADILVEIRLVRPHSQMGYAYRATAKSVASGRMLGSALLDNSTRAQRSNTRYIATAEGYERVELESGPAQEAVAREVALRLMAAMTNQLEN